MKRQTLRRLWFAGGLVLCIVFLLGALMPHPPSIKSINHFDKYEHAFAFVVISLWFAALFPRRFMRILVLLSSYGALVEILQWASGYRSGDVWDWVADTIGILIGLVLARLFVGHKLCCLEEHVAPNRN